MIRLLNEKDKKNILKYLERNEIETAFLYANVIEFGIDNRRDIRRCADYYGYFEGEELKGILSFYNLGSCIPHYEKDAAVPLFAELMKERSFGYLLGMRKIVMPLYEKVKDYKEILSCDESSYFINRNFKPFMLDGVNFIQVNKVISDKVIDFVLYARTDGFNQAATREAIKKSLIQRGEEEEFIIAERNGIMVAEACVQTYNPKVNQIGSVYTLKTERGKGYCKATVSELCRRIVNNGKIPTLIVKKHNTPAVKAYTSLGFEHYDDYLIVSIR